MQDQIVADFDLMCACMQRYEQSTDFGALGAALKAAERLTRHSRFADITPTRRIEMLSASAYCFLTDHSDRGTANSLNRAVDLSQQALAVARSVDPDNVPEVLLSDVAIALLERFEVHDTVDDLEAAVATFELAAYQCKTPECRARVRSNLSGALLLRFQRLDDARALKRARVLAQAAVDEPPPDCSPRPSHLHNLGNVLRAHYRLTFDQEVLAAALAAYDQAVKATPKEAPERAVYLSDAATALQDRYERTRDPADLTLAIAWLGEAVGRTLPGTPRRALRLGNFARASAARYPTTHDRQDLMAAVAAYREALDGPLLKTARPMLYNDLAVVLHNLAALDKDIALWDEAIDLSKAAVHAVGPAGTERAMFLNNLAVGWRGRFTETKDIADLKAAAAAWRKAVAGPSSETARRAGYRHNLANSLTEIALAGGNPALLPEAVHQHRAAIVATTAVAANLGQWWHDLGVTEHAIYARTKDPLWLHAAITSWERAWSLSERAFGRATVAHKLGQEHRWAPVIAQLLGAYLDLAQRGLEDDRTAARRMIELTEGVKARLLADLIGRTDMPLPSSISSADADRERMLRHELHELDWQEFTMHGATGPVPRTPVEQNGEADRQRRRGQCWDELTQLWDAMAATGPEAAEIIALQRGAALDWSAIAALQTRLDPAAAILTLYILPQHTITFLLRAGAPAPTVMVNQLGPDDWRAARERLDAAIQTATTDPAHETWDEAFQPMIEKLTPRLAGVERLIVVPHGDGYLMPWGLIAHRAGWRTLAGAPLPVLVLPALALIPRLKRRPPATGGPALVMGNPRGDLLHAATEAEAVAAHLGVTPLLGPQATVERACEALARAPVLHFAAHAAFRPGAPLDAGIELADGVLTARMILQHRLRADLVVVSACQSGLAESAAGPEFLGLAQALLAAGARSLVVSLWKVDDAATAALMRGFYRRLKAGSDNATALAGAAHELRATDRWRHPRFWGAFVLQGDSR